MQLAALAYPLSAVLFNGYSLSNSTINTFSDYTKQISSTVDSTNYTSLQNSDANRLLYQKTQLLSKQKPNTSSVKPCDTTYRYRMGVLEIESITCYDSVLNGKILATYNLIGFNHTSYYEGYIDSNHKFIKHGLMYVLDTFGVEAHLDTGYVCNYFHGNLHGQQRNYSSDSKGQKYLLHESNWYRGRPLGNWFSYYPDSQHSTYLIIKWHDVNGISYGDATYYFMNNKTKAKGQMRMFTAHLPCNLRSYFCITPPESNNGHCESFTTPIGKWYLYSETGNKTAKLKFPKAFKDFENLSIDCSKILYLK